MCQSKARFGDRFTTPAPLVKYGCHPAKRGHVLARASRADCRTMGAGVEVNAQPAPARTPCHCAIHHHSASASMSTSGPWRLHMARSTGRFCRAYPRSARRTLTRAGSPDRRRGDAASPPENREQSLGAQGPTWRLSGLTARTLPSSCPWRPRPPTSEASCPVRSMSRRWPRYGT